VARPTEDDADLREEYDFSRGVRGKYAARYAPGGRVIVLDPDVAEVFRDSSAVNDLLRALVKVMPPRALEPVLSMEAIIGRLEAMDFRRASTATGLKGDVSFRHPSVRGPRSGSVWAGDGILRANGKRGGYEQILDDLVSRTGTDESLSNAVAYWSGKDLAELLDRMPERFRKAKVR
jgi:hypothetical protein